MYETESFGLQMHCSYNLFRFFVLGSAIMGTLYSSIFLTFKEEANTILINNFD